MSASIIPIVECLDDNVASEFASGALAHARLSQVEAHLAGCRDCRALVAALAGTEADSNAATRPREKLDESAASRRPTKIYAVGDRVGRYLVLSTLGAGGMGVVFSAYDPQLDRKVALKLLRANLGGTAKDARARLKREAQAIAQLNHPNVVAVYDVGTTGDGDVYVAMEFVEGDTLTQWLKRWPRTWREIVDVFLQAARGLQAAHSVGLLHRDFKPDNVLVGGDGRVRVTDFGLARSVLGPDDIARPLPQPSALHAELTATGTVLGTPRYMPPEQLTGVTIDARSDQFSFCVALHEALYGEHPLPGATATGMLERGESALPPPEDTKVPVAIGRAIARGLDRDRARRFATMSALMAELAPAPERSRARLAAVALGALVIVGLTTTAVMSRGERTIEPAKPDTTELDGLRVELKQLQHQRDLLEQILLEHPATKAEIEQLRDELARKDGQIQILMDQVAKLRVHREPPRKASPNEVLTNALASAQHDVEFCFDEWSSREALDPRGDPTRANHKKLTPTREVQLVVPLEVGPTGAPVAAKTRDGRERRVAGLDDSPSTTLCVGDAIRRVRFPPSNEVLDVEVQVAWTLGPPDAVNMSARITGRHEATAGQIDLR